MSEGNQKESDTMLGGSDIPVDTDNVSALHWSHSGSPRG